MSKGEALTHVMAILAKEPYPAEAMAEMCERMWTYVEALRRHPPTLQQKLLKKTAEDIIALAQRNVNDIELVEESFDIYNRLVEGKLK